MDPAFPSESSPVGADVVCFQAERWLRPSLWLLRRIAPHPAGTGVVATAFGLPAPPARVRGSADQNMAELIRWRRLPAQPAARDADLCGLLRPLVETAIDACREADAVFRQAGVAQALVLQAEEAGAGARWLAPLRAVADRLATKAAALLVVAHLRSEEAEGAARAIGFARRGEPWEPPASDLDAVLSDLGASPAS